jgi:hypothetical protein
MLSGVHSVLGVIGEFPAELLAVCDARGVTSIYCEAGWGSSGRRLNPYYYFVTRLVFDKLGATSGLLD